jgi:ribonuclease HII
MIPLEEKAKRQGFRFIVGIDEAGRGPLAGPVVASAVCLTSNRFTYPIKDSKQISAPIREKLFQEILEKAHVGVGVMSEAIIDEHNILEATMLAMNAALGQLLEKLQRLDNPPINLSKDIHVFVDGNRFKSLTPCTYKTIVDGDEKVLSIACASIVAKVIRDRILNMYDQIFPHYGFKQHKGYPTAQHRKALESHGPTWFHRRTFRYQVPQEG